MKEHCAKKERTIAQYERKYGVLEGEDDEIEVVGVVQGRYKNITSNLIGGGNPGFMYAYFNPHPPEDIAYFYKSYIGEP